MFEKEAEEYTLQKLVGLEDFDSYQSAYYRYENGVQDAFKDGAELGFQKGIKARINTTTISDCPIKDEWHYVKDGDFPKENQWVLVYDGSYTVCNYHSNTSIKWLDNYENEVYEGSIIAWKEIVPPDIEEC